jgi:hypothetical protein
MAVWLARKAASVDIPTFPIRFDEIDGCAPHLVEPAVEDLYRRLAEWRAKRPEVDWDCFDAYWRSMRSHAG